VGPEAYTRLDVAIGAMVRGEWASFERSLTEGLACAARARDEDVTIEADAVETAATAFRYERDLISGDEMTAWLERAGLSLADWTAYFVRVVLRDRFAGDLDATIDRYPPSARQLHESARVEGLCSGRFDAFERALVHRAALAVGDDPAREWEAASEVALEVSRLRRRHAHWFDDQDGDDLLERFARAVRIERTAAVAAERLAIGSALRAMLDMRQMEWTRLDMLMLTVATRHAAREAILCVAVDGLSLDEVGRLARQTVERTSAFLEDLPDDRRVALFTADVGRAVGPLTSGALFQVAVVTGHTTPALDDDAVRARARSAVIHAAAERLASEHVRGRAGA